MNLPETGYTPRNLRVLMDIKGLSNDDVAQKLGVKKNTVSRWRIGKCTMPHEQWVMLISI